MPRNWGRMLGPTLPDSEKLAALTSVRDALVYTLMIGKHDGMGRIEVGDAVLLTQMGLFGASHDWTRADMAAAREAIVGVGLWRTYTSATGKLCAEVVDWAKHQRTDRINRDSDLLAEDEIHHGNGYPPVIPPISSKSLPYRGDVGAREEKVSEEKGSEGARARVAGAGPFPDADALDREEESRIHRAYCSAWERWQAEIPARERAPVGAGRRPGERELILEAVRLGTCRSWTGDRALEDELLRTIRGLARKGLTVSARSVLRHVGEEWGETAGAARGAQLPIMLGPVGLIRGEDLRREYEAISAETAGKTRPRKDATLSGRAGATISGEDGSPVVPAGDRTAGPLAGAVSGVVEKLRSRQSGGAG